MVQIVASQDWFEGLQVVDQTAGDLHSDLAIFEAELEPGIGESAPFVGTVEGAESGLGTKQLSLCGRLLP